MPAAAVIREGQALFGLTGRIEFVDCLINYDLNFKKTLNILIRLLNLEFISKKVEFYG